MATQTEAQVQTEIKDRVAILHDLRKAAGVNASGNISNYVAREQTAQNDVAGDYTAQSNAQLKAQVRASLNAAISSGAARGVLDGLFRNYARTDGTIQPTDIGTILSKLYQRFINTSLRVKGRNITFATPSAGSNLGSGAVNRLSVDAYGFNIEATHVEAKKAECARDSNTGTPIQEEVFLFQGATKNFDQLVIGGSGAGQEITAKSARTSLLANPSFDNLDGTSITALTSIPSWTVGAELIANYNLDQTNYYRSFQGASTPAAVKFLGNGSLTQAFSVNNQKFTGNRPAYLQVAYNRSVGSCDGRLWIALGNASVSVNLATASAGWNVLKIPLNRNLWPQNFAGIAGNTNTNIVIQLQGRTTGTLLVDDVILVQMDSFDGHFYTVVGGATPFVAGPNGAHDKFTWTDSLVGSDSVLQYWFWVAYGSYFPYVTDGSETWADPSV